MRPFASKVNLCLLVLLLSGINAELMVLTVQNCKVLTFLNSCSQCKDGYILDTQANKCSIITQQNGQAAIQNQLLALDTPQNVDSKTNTQNITNSQNIIGALRPSEPGQPVLELNSLPLSIILDTPSNPQLPLFIPLQPGQQLEPALPPQIIQSLNTNSKTATILSSTGSGVSILSIQDLNCKIRSKDRETCDQCYTAFYYDKLQKQCVPVSPLCRTWDKQGNCLSCFFGFNLIENLCKEGAALMIETKINDPNCFAYENGNCVECAYKFVFNKSGICTTVHPDCRTWDKTTGACLSCFEGYNLKNSQCLANQIINAWIAQNSANLPNANVIQIPNCAQYNEKNECIKCAFRFYFEDGQCESVSDLCKSWNLEDGQCMGCYGGYDLEGGKCNVRDPFCTLKSSQGCVQCANRYYLSVELKCLPVSPLCKAYDPLVGSCTDCYDGYSLKNGKCSMV